MAFTPYFQPLVGTQTGRLEGWEALARLNRGGQVADPSFFMSLINGKPERSEAFDWFMLSSVLDCCKEWIDTCVPFESVGWNVGQRSLASRSFTARLTGGLAKRSIEPKILAIEVTENALSGDSYERKLSNLEAALNLGCRVALDDFGTGGSSLSVLRDVPCSAVKIAGEFVDALSANWRIAPILQGIVDTSHSLGAVVVAENVETLAQLEAIRELGCDLAQGFYFSRPVPSECVPHVLDSWSERYLDSVFDAADIHVRHDETYMPR